MLWFLLHACCIPILDCGVLDFCWNSPPKEILCLAVYILQHSVITLMPGWYAEEMWGSVALYNPPINCQFFNVPVFQVTTATDTSASFVFFVFPALYSLTGCSVSIIASWSPHNSWLAYLVWWDTKAKGIWSGRKSGSPVEKQLWLSLSVEESAVVRKLWIHLTRITLSIMVLELQGSLPWLSTVRTWSGSWRKNPQKGGGCAKPVPPGGSHCHLSSTFHSQQLSKITI